MSEPTIETPEERAELLEWLSTWKAPDNTAASVAEIAVDALRALDIRDEMIERLKSFSEHFEASRKPFALQLIEAKRHHDPR